MSRPRVLMGYAIVFAAAGVASLSACRSSRSAETAAVPIVQPGAPGQPSQTIDVKTAVDLSRVRFTSADVEFMQGMISHHAQAIEMTDLLKTRTERPEMRKLAERIDISQADEIKMMQD